MFNIFGWHHTNGGAFKNKDSKYFQHKSTSCWQSVHVCPLELIFWCCASWINCFSRADSLMSTCPSCSLTKRYTQVKFSQLAQNYRCWNLHCSQHFKAPIGWVETKSFLMTLTKTISPRGPLMLRWHCFVNSCLQGQEWTFSLTTNGSFQNSIWSEMHDYMMTTKHETKLKQTKLLTVMDLELQKWGDWQIWIILWKISSKNAK